VVGGAADISQDDQRLDGERGEHSHQADLHFAFPAGGAGYRVAAVRDGGCDAIGEGLGQRRRRELSSADLGRGVAPTTAIMIDSKENQTTGHPAFLYVVIQSVGRAGPTDSRERG
jgi:hypothetical protein